MKPFLKNINKKWLELRVSQNQFMFILQSFLTSKALEDSQRVNKTWKELMERDQIWNTLSNLKDWKSLSLFSKDLEENSRENWNRTIFRRREAQDVEIVREERFAKFHSTQIKNGFL
jgi:hypothetical protein